MRKLGCSTICGIEDDRSCDNQQGVHKGDIFLCVVYGVRLLRISERYDEENTHNAVMAVYTHYITNVRTHAESSQRD